jgi:predicted nuclease with TOPRIM domain
MCRRNLSVLSAVFFFALFFSGPVTTWAVDIELAREEIQEARTILIALSESLTQRETDWQERESNLQARAKNLNSESEALMKDRELLEAEKVILIADREGLMKREQELSEREQSLNAQEASYSQIEKDMDGLTTTLSTLSWHLTLAKIGLLIEAVLVIVFIIL